MSDLKLYRVEVDHEIWVVAEDLQQANWHAAEALREEYEIGFFAEQVTNSTMPAPDNEDFIPWGERDKDDPDRTVAQWREVLGVKSTAKEK